MPDPPANNFNAIEEAMLVDRFKLRKEAKRLGRKPDPKKLAKLLERIDSSKQRAVERKLSIPEIEYPSELPVNQKREQICQMIRDNQVLIVCGETGSGKSTQLPKICLEAGFGIYGSIGHTQPRRIAARSVASRVAEELRSELGSKVGYKVRFQDRTSPHTLIKLMTDGILLAETQTDRFLEQYEVIIIDEAHERSLNIDFLLGFLKSLLPRRPDLHVIITSATIDAERFSSHFGNDDGPAPIVEVSGRNFPVEILYRFPDDSEAPDWDYFDGINNAVIELLSREPGDILIFLPTEKDIRTAAKKLRGLEFLRRGRATKILPLYARLSVAEQNRIFKPESGQRIVLATNVAESSLTVPRIKYVIDTGLARISRYSPRSKIQRLPIEKVSQASANQRAGRCGRLGPGVCVRLYSEEDFGNRDEFTTPEIRRTNLASVILQAKSMHLGDVDRIEFLDPPRTDSLRDGYKTLFEIGATDNNRSLTKLGQRLKSFPCDPRISRMILAGDAEGVLADVLIIAAAMEVQDVRDRPVDKQNQADLAHAQFANPDSDFMTLLNIWDFYHEKKSNMSNSKVRKLLQDNYLSFIRIREWLDVYRQLKELCISQKLKLGKRKNQYDNIHRALLAGMLSGIALKGDKYEYEGSGGIKSFLWPGSCLVDQTPRWILGTEVVETTRRFIRNVARIQPNWIEPLAKHLVNKSHSEPFWHEKSQKVMANEKVSLFGLTIIPRRSVPYGKYNPDVCRQIFIEQALVEEKLLNKHGFLTHNRELIEKVKEDVAKSRDRELIIDDAKTFQFYDSRIPPDVIDGVSLRQWILADPQHNEKLKLTRADLVEGESTSQEAFPNSLATQSINLKLEYAFEPGSDRDGITTIVPTVAISQLNEARLAWLVPGLLPQKIEALIRSLPKSKRRWFAPISETAQTVAAQLNFAKGDLYDEVSRMLTGIAEEPVNSNDFDLDKIDFHLKMNVEVTDEQGKVVDSSRNLIELQQKYCESGQGPTLNSSQTKWNQTGLTDWEFEKLPDQIQVEHGGMEINGFPAIVDEGATVGLQVFPSAQFAENETRKGVMRLASIRNSKTIRKQVRWLPDLENHAVIATQFSTAEAFKSCMADLISRRAFVDQPSSVPKSKADFEQLMQRSIEMISIASQDVAALLPKFFDSYHEMSLSLDRLKEAGKSSSWMVATSNGIHDQLQNLLPDRFWINTPWNWLVRFPVYFQSIIKRIEKLNRQNSQADQESESMLVEQYETYSDIAHKHRAQGIYDIELIKFRFMIEELRVSLFSQQLGTAMPVSEKRLSKQLEKVM